MSVSQHLSDKISAQELREDAVQMRAAHILDGLNEKLTNSLGQRNWFSSSKDMPKGLYMWGGVGRGKSLLMDVFFTQIQTPKKRRVHFHAFMQDVHAHIHTWRQLTPRQRRRHKNHVRGAGEDPIAPTAKALARTAKVLCFDEFHVTDIADAMILSRLFKALFARDVVVIATSNRAPDELYKDGLNRQLFLPFIELLKQKLEIFNFDGDTDHRLRKLQRAPVYYTPLTDKNDAMIEAAWHRLTRPTIAQNIDIVVQGRTLTMRAAGSTARAEFSYLCEQALGAADYLEIARQFTTLILEHVPILAPENRNEAKRFVTLIDALYEAKTNVIISAAAPPHKLYKDGAGNFEFERTASRLIEMQSTDYFRAHHTPAQHNS
jgi:cell division protein ZapE